MQTGVDERTKLESAVPALERLEEVIVGQRRQAFQSLHAFKNDPALTELKGLHRAQMNQFDLFQILNIQDSELAHSNFLAWLMDPNHSHALGPYFLKSFLFRTCKAAVALGLPAVPPAQIHAMDWSKTEIRREWENIDILILNPKARFVCAIENKIWADEGISSDGKSQLHWYRKTLQKHFSKLSKHYVFLSPTGASPQNRSDRRYWIPERYTTVRELVQQTLRDNDGILSTDSRVFLNQYAATLGRKIVPESNEVAQLARQIYLEHREAIELIYQHKPKYRDDMRQIVRETVAENGNWEFKDEDASWFRFRPVELATFVSMDTGTGWRSGASLLYQFYATDNNIHFYLTIAPGADSKVREKVFDTARLYPHLFNGTARAFSDGWLTIHQVERILADSDLNRWDDEDAPGPAKLRQWVKNFAENEFPAMNEVIVKCLEEYEAEQNG